MWYASDRYTGKNQSISSHLLNYIGMRFYRADPCLFLIVSLSDHCRFSIWLNSFCASFSPTNIDPVLDQWQLYEILPDRRHFLLSYNFPALSSYLISTAFFNFSTKRECNWLAESSRGSLGNRLETFSSILAKASFISFSPCSLPCFLSLSSGS